MKIKGAIFDMDGTLVDSLFYWPHFWKQFGQNYMNSDDFRPDEEIDKRIRTMIYADCIKAIKEYYRIDGSYEAFWQFATRGLSDFYTQKASLKEGAAALLAHLQKQNIKICLASATDMPYVKLVLSHFGIDKYFDCVLSCADIGVGKDKPDIYLLAADKLGLAPADLCVFEDSFIALETAKKAGFGTVGIFDKNNFAQDRLKNASNIYVENGQTLDALIPQITA